MTGVLLLTTLLGCGGRERVAWDAVSAEDAVSDVALALVLFGLVRETDREDLLGPHVLGGQLRMDAESRGDDVAGWRFEVLEPSIASVEVVNRYSSTVTVDIAFVGEGTTDLFVINDDGAVLDVQPVRVRAPDGAELVAWDELEAAQAAQQGATTWTPGTFHTVQGAFVDLAVTWLDRTGTRLVGGQLLTIVDDLPPRIDTDILFTGELDVLRLDVGANAPVDTYAIELSAAEVPRADLALVVHDAAEVDAVSIDVRTAPEGGGAAHAHVQASGQVLLGAPVDFRWDGRSEQGTILLFSGEDGDEPVPVTACYLGPDGEVCADASVPGTPTGVADRTAEAACGCQLAEPPGWGWLSRRR